METSAMIQDVMDMFAVTNRGEIATEIELDENVVLSNMLLTKESEVAALKEVVAKWRDRALEAESNTYFYYLDQLESIQIQHEIELKALESRYKRKLDEQQDVISSLKEQIDFLIASRQDCDDDGDTDSFISAEIEEEEEDNQSTVSSVYDREMEQGLVTIENTELLQQGDSMKSETILCNIQNTMRAIESEINAHQPTQAQKRYRHRRSPTLISESTAYSSSTLIDSEAIANKRIKTKSSFFIHRIFKKAFPKFYNKNNTVYNTKSFYSSCQRNSTATIVRNDSILV